MGSRGKRNLELLGCSTDFLTNVKSSESRKKPKIVPKAALDLPSSSHDVIYSTGLIDNHQQLITIDSPLLNSETQTKNSDIPNSIPNSQIAAPMSDIANSENKHLIETVPLASNCEYLDSCSFQSSQNVSEVRTDDQAMGCNSDLPSVIIINENNDAIDTNLFENPSNSILLQPITCDNDQPSEPCYATLQPITCYDQPSTSYAASCSRNSNELEFFGAYSDDSVRDPDYIVPHSSHSSSDEEDVPLIRIKDKVINRNKEIVPVLEGYTKKGEKRKRRRLEEPLSARKAKKIEQNKLKHHVKTSCADTCKKKCTESFTDDERKNINTQYWQMTFSEKRNFISSYVTSLEVKRHRSRESRRNKTLRYYFKCRSGDRVEVCKIFFLSTLGYNKNNDRILQDCFTGNTQKIISHRGSIQGKHAKTPKIDRDVIKAHVETFNPAVSHYRREHAPHRRYLPSDLSIQLLYSDFRERHPEFVCSYEVYRNVVTKEMKISFTKLGHEECEICETFVLHNPEHTKENPCTDCQECLSWKMVFFAHE